MKINIDTKKKAIIISGAVILVGALGVGTWYFYPRMAWGNKEKIEKVAEYHVYESEEKTKNLINRIYAGKEREKYVKEYEEVLVKKRAAENLKTCNEITEDMKAIVGTVSEEVSPSKNMSISFPITIKNHSDKKLGKVYYTVNCTNNRGKILKSVNKITEQDIEPRQDLRVMENHTHMLIDVNNISQHSVVVTKVELAK